MPLVVTGTASLPVHMGGKNLCNVNLFRIVPGADNNAEIQCKTLGMKIEVFDPSGKNIEHTGTPGELVCTRPHPSLPLYFWGDATGEKLRDAYFNMFPGKKYFEILPRSEF